MVGSDINKNSVLQAIKNVNYTKGLSEKISIKHQENNANIFEGIINENDQFTFT
ncbi:MAG TPA: 23S rRNA (adenine(1618)-N(6))-methyltransferase, partial [Flavobacteriaceae bacterium]|nr:23S rRNA (adenine(1618)-N(6))-methyltransferase [Flavobacteriaceae bacterium]